MTSTDENNMERSFKGAINVTMRGLTPLFRSFYARTDPALFTLSG